MLKQLAIDSLNKLNHEAPAPIKWEIKEESEDEQFSGPIFRKIPSFSNKVQKSVKQPVFEKESILTKKTGNNDHLSLPLKSTIGSKIVPQKMKSEVKEDFITPKFGKNNVKMNVEKPVSFNLSKISDIGSFANLLK